MSFIGHLFRRCCAQSAQMAFVTESFHILFEGLVVFTLLRLTLGNLLTGRLFLTNSLNMMHYSATRTMLFEVDLC